VTGRPDGGDDRSAAENPAAQLDVRLVPAALTGWLVTAAGIVWPAGAVLASLSGSVVAISATLLWRLRSRPDGAARLRAIAVAVLAVGVVGTGYGLAVALRANAIRHHPIAAAYGRAARVLVIPSESAVPVGSSRLLFRATLHRLGSDDMSGRVVVFAPARDFAQVQVGQPVQFDARVAPPSRRDLTVAVLNARGAAQFGAVGPVHRVAHAVRERFAAGARRVLAAPEAAMLPALVLGDTSAVTDATGREFRVAGLTHLMAVSGANVTIVCGAVLVSARLIGPRPAVGLAATALAAFVIVVEPTASVLRAAVMGGITLLAILSSRRRQALPALSAAVLMLLIAAPQLAVDVGFALSVIATAALVVIAPVWSQRMVDRGCPRLLADAVAVAWAAHVVTAPLVAGISGRVSLVGALANLAVAPVIAPITVLGSAAAALSAVWPAPALLLIRFTGAELWWVLHLAHWAAGVPAAAVAVPAGIRGVVVVGAGAVLTVVLWRRRWFRTATAAATVGLLAWSVSGVLVGSSGPA
jgi:competence protein ComEC